MKFPNSEAKIVELANACAAGLNANNAIYPAPPVAGSGLLALVDLYTAARDAAIAFQAQAEIKFGLKDVALANLEAGLKKDLRYAENTVNDDDDKLKLLGWGGRKPRTPIAAPGQTQGLSIHSQGEGSIDLAWKKPASGGMPAAFTVQRRLRTGGAWDDVATAVADAASLGNQERGKEFEYRVVAINRAGEGAPSNTVMAVL
jgi:hypothetical protein